MSARRNVLAQNYLIGEMFRGEISSGEMSSGEKYGRKMSGHPSLRPVLRYGMTLTIVFKMTA